MFACSELCWPSAEVLTELHRSQESAYNLRDSARQSHLNRAKLCSKLIKYPHVEDYTVRVVILAHFVLLNILLLLFSSPFKNMTNGSFISHGRTSLIFETFTQS